MKKRNFVRTEFMKLTERLMKRNLLYGLMSLIVTALCFVACDDGDDDVEEYYVRYTVGADAGDDFFVSYLDEKGQERIWQGKSADGKVEVVAGPVHCGFKASLAASVNGGRAPEYSRIEVSRDGRPFVQKVYLQNGTYIYHVITAEDR